MFRTSNARLMLSMCSLLLAACTPQDNPADAKFKQALLGTWRGEYTTSNEQLIRRTVTFANDGNFVEKEVVGAGATKELSHTGLWYVTEGLLKLNTQKTNGQDVGVIALRFFTCRLETVKPDGFVCRNDVEQNTYTFVRAG